MNKSQYKKCNRNIKQYDKNSTYSTISPDFKNIVMKLSKIPILILTFIIFIGCNKTKKRENEISKITLLTGLCYGTCPVQSIEVDSSLTLKYHGESYAKIQGFYIGKITEANWDSINSKFEKIKYKELDSVYEHSVDDAPTYIEIRNSNKVKTIRAQSESLPEEVQNTYYWLIDLCNKTKLVKTNDTLGFEKEHLKIMYPPPPPPPLIRNKK